MDYLSHQFGQRPDFPIHHSLENGHRQEDQHGSTKAKSFLKRLFPVLLIFLLSGISPAVAFPLFATKPSMGEHYSPAENLEVIDIAMIRQARHRIDIAMYAFTDRHLAKALIDAAGRGVRIRIYRDRIQIHDRGDQSKKLLEYPGITLRIKRNGRSNIMHLKAYEIDGRLLRTGSANWSPPGEGAACRRSSCGHRLQQDNNLFLTEDPRMVQGFEKEFNHLWNRPENMRHLPPRSRHRHNRT